MKITLLFIFACCAIDTNAQEEHLSKPCDAKPDLKSLLKNGTIKELYAYGGYEDTFSSSILKPGTPNKATRADYANMNESEKIKYEQWSCQYGARNASDDNARTAWVEGVAGAGTGEVLLLTEQVNPAKAVELWSGYGASDNLFKANNRPKTIGVHVVRSMPDTPGQYGRIYRNLTIVTSAKITLQDVNRFQGITVPRFRAETFRQDGNDWDYAYWLLLEIIDVYPGTKYQDTCITEVRNTR